MAACMHIDIITIFPSFFDSFLSESLIKKACDKKIISFRVHNLRDFTTDKHKTVDDRPYGGGAGMLLKIEPLVKAIRSIRKKIKTRTILLSPAGKQFTQKKAGEYSKKYNHLIFVCGRYEGFDARIKKYIDEELSIGPYILNGGEVAAMAVIEATFRLLPEALGNKESLAEESHSKEDYVEYPQYTRPEVFQKKSVPKVLLSGNHKKIEEWKTRKYKKR